MLISLAAGMPSKAAAVVGTTALLMMALASPASADATPSVQSATVTITSTMSYTATSSREVSATASWGSPAITKTVTETLTGSDTESATRSATVTQTAAGESDDAALSAATSAATFWATLQSQIEANTAASIDATTIAAHNLIPLVAPKQTELYNQALAQAKAAVLARDGAPVGKPDACGAARFKADGTQWSCSFNDEFTGTKLNTAKWTAWNGVNYWSDPDTCYYSDSSHVAVAGGSLNLSVTRMPATAKCLTGNGNTKPIYGAGLVHTKGKFSQTNGLFEARIKFAGGKGIHNAFWLYPDDASSGDHAEIDIAEPRGSAPDTMYPAIHRTAPGDSTELGAMWNCALPNWAAGYHTYSLQWTPTDLQFTYDGTVCATTPNTGEYARNFYSILQVLADNGSDGPTASTPLPAKMSVDWMRVWK